MDSIFNILIFDIFYSIILFYLLM